MLLAQSACLLQCATQPTKSSVLTHSLTLLPFLVTPGLQLLASGAAKGSYCWPNLYICCSVPLSHLLTRLTRSSHSLTLLPFLVTPGLQLLASGAKDCEVRVWDPRSGVCLGAGAGHIGAVAAVALARSKAKAGSFLVSAGADKLLKVWDTSKALEAAAAAGVDVAGRWGFCFGVGGGGRGCGS